MNKITIGENVTRIENDMFKGNTELTTVIIGSNVSHIGTNIFDGCDKLTSIIFKDTTTWYVGNTEGATSTQIAVNNSSTNVTNFKNTYSNQYWTKQ